VNALEKYNILIESLIDEITTENPHLKKLGGLFDLNQLLNPCSNDEIVELIKSVRFSINPFVSDSIFKKVKSDLAKIYIDINFEYSVFEGVSYRIDPLIVETLDINISEYVFDAVEELLPDKKYIINSQWESWTIEQKEDLLYELEKAALKKANEWLKEKAATYFLHFEKKTSESILQLIKTGGPL
jgi:hypothetical protein